MIDKPTLLYLAQEIFNKEIFDSIQLLDPSAEELVDILLNANEHVLDFEKVSENKKEKKQVFAYGATDPLTGLHPMMIPRRAVGADDVGVAIKASSICHSDDHHEKNEWGDSKYPLVPGHEIIGQVVEIGDNVTRFKLGDIVAIGNMVDSCGKCLNCKRGAEQYCLNGGPSWTYNSHDRMIGDKKSLFPIGDMTFGGFSTYIVAKERFVLKLPAKLNPYTSPPLLCAGITVYNPMKLHNIGPGKIVGIAGIGGLGHLGVKIAKALGATQVVALTTSPWKLDDAVHTLGADDAVLVTDPFDRQRYKNKFDFILSTVPGPHDADIYLEMVQPNGGALHIVGNMQEFTKLDGRAFVFHGKEITSSNVGGLAVTKEMLNFCAKNGIEPIVEFIDMEDINEAMQAMIDKQVRYRFVMRIGEFE